MSLEFPSRFQKNSPVFFQYLHGFIFIIRVLICLLFFSFCTGWVGDTILSFLKAFQLFWSKDCRCLLYHTFPYIYICVYVCVYIYIYIFVLCSLIFWSMFYSWVSPTCLPLNGSLIYLTLLVISADSYPSVALLFWCFLGYSRLFIFHVIFNINLSHFKIKAFWYLYGGFIKHF